MSSPVRLLRLLLLVAAVCLGLAPSTAGASHNRASQLTWHETGEAGEVEFHLDFAARRGYYGAPEVGDPISDPQIDFGDGETATPELEVTAVDADHDVIYASAEVTHTYAGPGPFTASLTGCCRLQSSSGHINNPDQSFRAETRVNFSSPGSPHSSIAPIIDCRPDTSCSFNVVAADPAGRKLRWRMATAAEASGEGFNQPGAPNAPHAASIDSATGRYSWDSSGAQLNGEADTFYSTQVIVETVNGAGQVVTSAAVDFFIRLTDEARDLRPACVDSDNSGSVDNDQDGLCDNWESSGIDFDGDGTVDLRLYDVNGDGTINAVERADPNVKDIFVEIDHMKDLDPDLSALNGVTRAFLRAPQPIRLHYVSDEQVPFAKTTAFGDCGSNACPTTVRRFQDIKDERFGKRSERASQSHEAILGAKRFAFHYALWINKLEGSRASGRGETPGNDFVVSLGDWGVGGGTPEQQAGTFMHELGHNLGLRHGGGDQVNCKPNYLSVMSYTRQSPGYVLTRPLDYSRAALPTLNEDALDEHSGISPLGFLAFVSAHGPGRLRRSSTVGPVDWNDSGDIQGGVVSADINNLGENNCSGDGSVLLGYNDWANLDLAFQATADFSDGVNSTLYSQDPELTYDSLAAVSPDTDRDGVIDADDLCPAIADAGQENSDGEGAGDACQPIARNDVLRGAAGARLDFGPPGVLANDTLAGGTLEPARVTTTQGGLVVVAASGAVQYTPRSGFTGTDSFEYELVNGLATSTATASIVVGGTATGTSPPGGSAGAPARTFPAARRTVRLTRAKVRYSRRRHAFVVTFRLGSPARVKFKVERWGWLRFRRSGRAVRKAAKAGRNRIIIPVRAPRVGRWRVTLTARAAGMSEQRAVRRITIRR